MLSLSKATKTKWFLTTNALSPGKMEFIELEIMPFRVGRKADLSLTVQRSTVSSNHAEFFERQGEMWIRDLNSTNGTYVNGKPVTTEERLQVGDLIQFADVAFRLAVENESAGSHTLNNFTVTCDSAASLAQFDRLMNERAVVPHFQPIVQLETRRILGYEVLGRSTLTGLEKPAQMFLAASQLNLEAELSVMLRLVAMEKALLFPEKPSLYLNTHPAEIMNCGLLASLKELRAKFPDQPITLEVHEAAATSIQVMRELRDALNDLNMELAYDDFGTGQSRLVELASVCPDVVKFDIKFVREIDLAPPKQQQMLASLVRMVRELNIIPLAEGVEREEEHAVLKEMGFQLGQGFLYGFPETQSQVMEALAPECVC
jgi:EAL domain-containing protein (putative c-di-GMP-specific phosphodiesterase class I)